MKVCIIERIEEGKFSWEVNYDRIVEHARIRKLSDFML